MVAIGPVALLGGSPRVVPLDGIADEGQTLTFTATSDNPNVTLEIPEGNRSMRISVRSADGAIDGDMVLELFEDRAGRVTSHIIELAESGFYDGVIFHRVMDDFMIQTGDPTGTGSGGSYLGEFDDQFDVDLQHNGSGVLSMAKSDDDTNDSQFFITGDSTRWLDFNHSIFGHLVEGEDIRDAISSADTTGDDPVDPAVQPNKPLVDIVMESVEIFHDTENAVLMLKAPEGYTGGANITITITDALGNHYVQDPFHVTVTPDTEDGSPFFEDLPDVRTAVDTPVTFNLEPYTVDVEGDAAYYLDDLTLDYNELYDPLRSHEDLEYEVGFETGTVTVSPTNGLVGIHPVVVGTAAYADAIDYQFVPVYIVPDTPPDSSLDMTLVRDATEVDSFGEVATLPQDQWIDEWDRFAIEIWAAVDDTAGQFGVHTVSTDLVYDRSLFTATEIEYGTAFHEDQTGQIDAAAGRVNDIGGTTRVFTVDPYTAAPDVYPSYDSADVNLYGDGAPVLVARVYFEPNLGGAGVPLDVDGQYPAPIDVPGFAFEGAVVKWSGVDATNVTTHGLADAHVWPVIYDIDDSGTIDLGDLSYFAAAYHHNVGDAGATWSWAGDYDHDGTVGLGDLSFFAANYRRGATSAGRSVYAENFPADWQEAMEASAPPQWQYARAANDAASPRRRATVSLAPAVVDRLMLIEMPGE
jgi:cyclophilin family peptidyl-prolyl cis-trans isomerase